MFKAGPNANLGNSRKEPRKVQGEVFDEVPTSRSEDLESIINVCMVLFCRSCWMGNLEAVGFFARQIEDRAGNVHN